MPAFSGPALAGRDGRPASMLHTPEQAERVEEAHRQVLASGQFRGEIGHRRRDGSTFPALMSISLLRDPQERAIGTIATCLDITDLNGAEERLRAERDRAEKYLDIAGVMFVAIGRGEELQLINRLGCEILGRPAGEIIGRNWFDLALPAAAREEARRAFRRLVNGEAAPAGECNNLIVTRDGRERQIHWHNTVLRDESGRITGTLSSGEDVTEPTEVERQRAMAKFAVDRSSVGAYWLRPDGRFVYVNDAACRMEGHTRQDMESMHVWDLDPDMSEQRWHEHWQDVRRRGSFTFESRHRTRSGRVYPVEITVNYIKFGQEEFNFAFARDISDRKTAEESLRRADRLKADFIRIASHELRTPVSYIIGLAQLLRGNRDPERLAAAVQNIAAKAGRLNEIILAMFKLIPGQLRPEKMHYVGVALPSLLDEIRAECTPFTDKRNQQLAVDLGGDLPVIRADRDKLRDVLENLVMNAIKFTPDAGRIVLRAESRDSRFVSVSVRDQGPGIPQADLPYLFEPFFSGGQVMQHSTGTIEFQKRGMGLGLAIARQFVEMHGGSIGVATGPQGSTFTVSLPVVPPPRSTDTAFSEIGVARGASS